MRCGGVHLLLPDACSEVRVVAALNDGVLAQRLPHLRRGREAPGPEIRWRFGGMPMSLGQGRVDRLALGGGGEARRLRATMPRFALILARFALSSSSSCFPCGRCVSSGWRRAQPAFRETREPRSERGGLPSAARLRFEALCRFGGVLIFVPLAALCVVHSRRCLQAKSG